MTNEKEDFNRKMHLECFAFVELWNNTFQKIDKLNSSNSRKYLVKLHQQRHRGKTS